MPRLTHVATTVAAALLLTACGGTGSDPSSDTTGPNVDPATNTSAAEQSDGPEQSSRGNIIKNAGEPAEVPSEGEEGDPVLTFNVKNIEADPACTSEYALPPENGHFVAFDIEVETGTPEQFEETFYSSDYKVNFSNWDFIAPNGTRANSTSSGAMFGCLNESEKLPDQIGPGERATGRVVIDVPDTEGTFIYTEPMSQQSWEWELPAK